MDADVKIRHYRLADVFTTSGKSQDLGIENSWLERRVFRVLDSEVRTRGCCYWNHDNPIDKICCVQVKVVWEEEALGGWKETMSAIGHCSNPISFDYSRTITSLVMV